MRWGSVVVVVVLLAAMPAAAQESGGAASEADEAHALELFERAVALYREGEFAESARLLREAYAIHEEPVLLYNLARALEGDGKFAEAIDAYQRYLDTAGEIPDRGAIERKLVTLRRNVDERARLGRFDETVEDTPERGEGRAEAPPPAQSGPSPSPVPWIVAGVGAVGLGVAGVLGGIALGAHDAAVAAPTQSATEMEQRRAQDLAVATNVTLVASAVVLAAGVTWGIIDLTSTSSSAGTSASVQGDVTARVRVGLGSIALEGSFR